MLDPGIADVSTIANTPYTKIRCVNIATSHFFHLTSDNPSVFVLIHVNTWQFILVPHDCDTDHDGVEARASSLRQKVIRVGCAG